MDKPISQMDRKVGKTNLLKKHRYIILFGIIMIAILIFVIKTVLGPSKLRYSEEDILIAEVVQDRFTEYVEVEGIVQPIMVVRLTSYESGIVSKIVAHESNMLKAGDTILLLNNPELMNNIKDDRYELEKKRITHQEKMLQMERKSSELLRNSLKTTYELERLGKQYGLDKEEFKLGVKSSAQLEVASDEYEFNVKNTRLIFDELRSDSIMNQIQIDLIKNDMAWEEEKYQRKLDQLANLMVRAPVDGQLGFISVILGERVAVGTNLGEMKVIDDLKLVVDVSEFYMERLHVGLPASLTYLGEKIPLRITRIYPEVKDRTFRIDLVFTDKKPDNIVLGKNYRVQIELGLPQDAVIVRKGNFYQYTGGQWIFKLDASGKKAVRTDIIIGRQNPLNYEILDGLKPGDKVVLSGYDNFGNVQELILK